MSTVLTPDRIRRIAEVYEAALDLEESLRGPYLAALARTDLDLVRRVHMLLEAQADETEPAMPASASTPKAEAPPGEENREIGPYRLIELLGIGGMGAVHLAERSDSEFERLVAIKVIRFGLDVPEVRRRFLSERQILASFDHPNIAKMHEGGTTSDGLPYLVMEYVEGVPIDRYCDENRLTVKARLKLFRQVCSAVEYAHRNLVVHRDLKPSNVLVTAEGVPKLLDFGIAKLLDPEHFPLTVEITETGRGPLTPSYASPEQLAAGRVTTLSDVYSLGVLLYRLLTGRLPFDRRVRSREILAREAALQVPTRPSLAIGTTQDASSESRLQEPTGDSSLWSAAPKQHRRQLQGDLDNIVLTALRTEPNRRYGSVQLLSEDLERHLDGEPVRARKASALYRTGKFLRRHRFPVAALVTLFAFGVAFLGVTLKQNRDISQARDQAVEQEKRAEQVADFFVELFTELNPGNTLGREVNSREILDKAAQRLLAEADSDPAVRVRLLNEFGVVYFLFGDVETSGELLKTAYEQAQDLGGLVLASATLEWSRYQGYSGSPEEAFELSQDAVSLYEEAGNLFGQAEALSSTSLWAPTEEKAIELADKAYSLALEVADWELTEATLNNLAMAHWGSDPQKALRFTEEAVQLWRDRGDLANDPGFLRSLGNLAYQYQMVGQLAKAGELHLETLERTLAVLGPESPDLGVTHNNFSHHALLVGDYTLAESQGQKALSIWENSFGKEAGRLRHPLNKLCQSLIYMGQAEEARPACERALKITEPVPSSHLLANLDAVRLHRFLGDSDRARQHLETSNTLLESLSESGGAQSWHQRRFALERGLIESAAGRDQQAADSFRTILAMTENVLEETDIYGVVWRLLAKLYISHHDEIAEEVDFLREAGARDRELELYCLGAGDPPTCSEIRELFPERPWTGTYPSLH